MLKTAIPALSQLLIDYNASLSRISCAQRQLRIRVVVHAGEVHYDANGCFGETLDIAFRLLDAAHVKKALQAATDPLILVISGDIYRAIVRHGYDGIDNRRQPHAGTFPARPTVQTELANAQIDDPMFVKSICRLIAAASQLPM